MSDISHFSIDFLSKSPFFGWSALVILLALSVYHYGRTNPPLPARIKYPLLALRTVAIIALILTLLEPVISYGLSGERRQRMTIALDVSGSMRQENDGSSRLASVDSVFAESDNLLGRLAEEYEITRRYFADSLTATREAVNAESSGLTGGTAIGEALVELAQTDVNEPADVWLLISDGINNTGREPAQVAEDVQTPTFTIGVGEQSQEFDIEIADVDYNPVAYVGAETPVKVSLRWRGAGETAPEALVSLQVAGAKDGRGAASTQATSRRIKLGQGELSAEVELKFTPTSPGAAFLSATVTTAQKEQRTANNSRAFAIKVLKSRLKVALVSETLDWDYKFLKEALKDNERVAVTSIVEKSPGEYLSDKFPSSPATLNEFDVVVLLNPSGMRRDMRYSLLQSYVSSHGGGLFVIAGERLFSGRPKVSGGAAPVPLSSLLPLAPMRGYQRMLNRTTAITLRGEHLLHPALRIAGKNENVRDVWRSFPPFVSVAPLTEVVSDSGEALVLAESDYQIQTPGAEVVRGVPDTSSSEAKPVALLVAQKRGAGKVLELNGAPVWRMAFQSVETELTARHFSEFINGAINWLAVTEDISPVKIEPERPIYARGEIAVFSGSAFDQSYRPLDGYSGDVFLYGADDADTLVATLQSAGEGVYRAEFSGLTPGTYRFEGRSSVDGELIKTDTGRIRITQYSLEQRQTTPDFGVLQTIAQKTGGKYAHLSNVNELEQTLTGAPVKVSEEVEIPLRGDWRFLAVFILALSIEWFVRKRLQLL